MNQALPYLMENESLHDLQLGGLQLIQKNNGFKFGMDAVLLSDFCSSDSGDIIADFGTGTGILPVLLCGKNKCRHVYAFEIQQDMAEMAQRSVLLNHLDKTISIFDKDCVTAPDLLGINSLDAVIMNPPYGECGKTMVNPDSKKAIARHQSADSLDTFFRSAFLCLKGKGKLYLIYPVQNIYHVMDRLHHHHLEPKRFRLVYPYIDKPANLVLIEAMKDARPGLLSMPPLIVYSSPGNYTDELNRIYHIRKPVSGSEVNP